MFYVYTHTRLDTNEVFYVGIGTIRTKGNKYFRAYSKNYRSQFWKNVVSKNQNYQVDICFEFSSREESIAKEIELIKFYGRRNLGTGTLVNMTEGGDGGKTSLISPMKGKFHSKETRLKLSESRKRYIKTSVTPSGMYGKTHTEESKRKMSIGMKGRVSSMKGKKASIETRKKQSERKSKPVIVNGEKYNSIMIAASLLGVDRRRIYKLIHIGEASYL